MMEITIADARKYPMVYAPEHAFKWVREGDFFKSVYRVICDWEDDVNVGNVLGWVHKLEIDAYVHDDEVDTMVLVTVPESGVIAWVAGSDKLWCVPKYADHIRVTDRHYLDCSCNICRMRMYEIDEAVSDVHTQVHEREKAEGNEDIAIHEYVLCEDCIRDLDDEVLEAISQAQTNVRKRELDEVTSFDPAFELDDDVLDALDVLAEEHKGGLPVVEIMTDAQLDAQLVREQEEIIETLEGIAGEYVADAIREDEARQHARSLLEHRVATPVVRQILEDVGTLMCMSGLDNVRDEVTERPMLFTSDRRGRTDSMQVYLEELGKVVDVRVTEF